ncbi:sugar ABC transporter substrate-binding protein [Exilibacterium tricleocarpae]|uniref:Sugar ABC transporter substrate-binding protein n=1 Tax=Exilibacterium tricleocarpae TaxID=2591008 RepID=A0A545T3K0_9GAMM|nr:XrtA/PEP-CTERM system exopolysaccharide export protein [Exilibacterium tricleocarpae]TQV71778.1 sugar ABC transporter substrate-binding protein [Exilibacterium tricleocarpae]
MKKLVSILSLVSTLIVSGCAGVSPSVDTPERGNAVALNEYKIGVGDQLNINVWKNNDLSLSVPVRPDGKVSMPLVGDVLAAGQTTEGLSKTVAKQLSGFIRNPQVTVIVTNASSSDFQHRVRITGAVQSALSTSYRDGMTVLDLVLLAGGTNEFAAANKTKLYRKVHGSVKVYPIYLEDILKKGRIETNFDLAPSDIIIVPERSF